MLVQYGPRANESRAARCGILHTVPHAAVLAFVGRHVLPLQKSVVK